MNKKGFTLQEALITIGIIGIIAAITVPGLTKLLPNQNQTRFLKAYATLSELTKQMLVDPTLYWTDSNCDGLACNAMPVQGSVPDALLSNDFLGQFPNPTPVQKYAAILAYNMHLSTNALNAAQTAFITTDGIQWVFQPNPNDDIQVDIDVDGSNQVHIQPAQRNQIDFNQDTFSLIVTMDGEIQATDATAMAYLENETINLNRRSKAAQDLLANNNGNPNVPAFRPCATLKFDDLCTTQKIFCSKEFVGVPEAGALNQNRIQSHSNNP